MHIRKSRGSKGWFYISTGEGTGVLMYRCQCEGLCTKPYHVVYYDKEVQLPTVKLLIEHSVVSNRLELLIITGLTVEQVFKIRKDEE